MFKKLKHGYLLYTILFKQKKVPIKANVALIAAAIYILAPIDLFPDIFVLVGYIDDLLLTGGVLYAVYGWLNKAATPADKAKAKAIDV